MALRRRRRRQEGPDLGEGCSYAVLSSNEIGSTTNNSRPSKSARSQQDSLTSKCTCTPTPRTRRRLSPSLVGLAVSTAILAPSTPHASASPVQQAVGKGKGRAVEGDDLDTPLQYDEYSNNDAQAVPALPLQPANDDLSDTSRFGQLHLPASSDQQQQHHHQYSRRSSRDRTSRRSNTPDGVPSHFEYVDGHWVPSSDWSLNGQNGARHGGTGGGSTSSRDDDDDSALDAGTNDNDDGPSTRQNNATPTATPRIGDEAAYDDDSALSTTLGWAKSTNAILGVDIDTALSSLSSSSSLSLNSNNMVTRSNMATYTPASPSSSSRPSSSSSAPAAASSTSPSGSNNSTNSNSNGATAYDFSRDVPNGWVSDGRTAAYAVPVIIGLSVFLACIIFGLILVLLRMNKSRKKKRKQALNGHTLKLSEEGKLPTRPNSPALTVRSTTSSTISRGGDDAQGLSTSITRRTNVEGEENHEKSERRRIGRKWTPNLSGNGALRRRRKKIAQLFKRDDPAKEIIVVDGDDAGDGVEHQAMNDGETNQLRRRRSLSTSSFAAGDSGRAAADSLSRTATRSTEQISATTVNASDRAYVRPPSLRLDTNAALLSTATVNDQASPSSPLATASPASHGLSIEPQQQLQHGRNESVDAGDHHAVPVPSVGPPAYMQPSTPAYSRAPAGGASSTSSSSGTDNNVRGNSNTTAIPASGYLSAVSTPGISTGLVNEKRALLGFASVGDGADVIVPGSSNDAFREQRRFEHLYSSREGEDAHREQMTGAPTLVFPSSSSAASASASGHLRSRRDDADADENMARAAQQEAIEEHTRELQQSLAGHVAISDKEILGRLRMAASAPLTSSSPSSSMDMSAAVAGSMLQASAPSLEETEDEDRLESERLSSNDERPEAVTSSMASNMLPQPPKPVTTRLALDRMPQVDEKTRLRQIEDRQATSSFSPILLDTDALSYPSTPSAPPTSSMPPSNFEASAPSAPIFDECEGDNAQYNLPSAPPASDLDMAPSAPVYVLEEEEEELDAGTSDPETRPYHEGII